MQTSNAVSESDSGNDRYIFQSLCRHQESENSAENEQATTATPDREPAAAVTVAGDVQAAASAAALRSVVRLYVDEVHFDWKQPYSRNRSGSGVGSAAVIDEDDEHYYLLTAFHVVASAVRVRCSFASLGRAIHDAKLLGACPEVDTAMLRVTKRDLPAGSQSSIYVLPLGDSDRVETDDEVRVLGFPQGENSVWSTKGVIAGRLSETGQFQLSASVNPGNSGGPLVDRLGALIGVVVSKHAMGDGMGYATPLAQIKPRLADMKRHVSSVDDIARATPRRNGLLRIPSHNCVLGIANRALMNSLAAPEDVEGAYVRYVLPGSVLHRSGVRAGDILVRLGCKLDFFGQVEVAYWNKRLHIDALMPRASLNTELLVEWWSADERRLRSDSVLFNEPSLFGLRERYPPREPVDFETFGGVVVMQLNVQHLRTSSKFRDRYRYVVEDPTLYAKPPLIVSHIMSGSSLSGQPLIESPDTVTHVNGVAVATLAEYRGALFDGAQQSQYIRWQTKDGQVSVLEYDKALQESQQFSAEFGFEQSLLTKRIAAKLAKVEPVEPIVA